jgi:organic hydroperoxide reductase OsmC/OhrA
MSEHKATIVWQRETSDFAYDTYDRTHTVTYGGGSSGSLAAAPEYKGNAKLPNPEELLVAALSSCHMLTFLAIAAKKRLTVDHYEDAAVGHMTKNADGKLYVSEVLLKPVVRFKDPVDEKTLADLHHRAHAECFIANSVLTKVRLVA